MEYTNQCPYGFGGPNCDVQQCSIQDGGFCHEGGKCVLDDAQESYSCYCDDGFTTSGFDCVVTNPKYLSHTVSYVLLSLGIVCVVLGAVWVVWQFKHFTPSQVQESPENE